MFDNFEIERLCGLARRNAAIAGQMQLFGLPYDDPGAFVGSNWIARRWVDVPVLAKYL